MTFLKIPFHICDAVTEEALCCIAYITLSMVKLKHEFELLISVSI